MARSGRLRRLGGGLNSEDQFNPKTNPATALAGGRFRPIVDGWATFNPGACAPHRRMIDDAVSPSTIRLKRASTITEIRTQPRLITVAPVARWMHGCLRRQSSVHAGAVRRVCRQGNASLHAHRARRAPRAPMGLTRLVLGRVPINWARCAKSR